MLYAVAVFLRYGTFLAGQMGRQVGQEDTARDQQDADAPQEGDLLLQEHRAAAHGAAAEAAEGRAAACGKGGTGAGRADARPNAKGEHTWTCVIRLLRLPAALEERADEQDDHKDDEVEQHLDMVGADGGVYHEQGAQGGQDGHDLAAEGGQIIALH